MRPEKIFKKYKIWIIFAIIGLSIFAIVKEPVFFDNFGIGVFIFILISSSYMLMKKRYPEILLWILFIIGGAGLIVDGIQILK